MEASNQLIISVAEARRLLGRDAAGLTDEQIIDYILALTAIASLQFINKKVPKNA